MRLSPLQSHAANWMNPGSMMFQKQLRIKSALTAWFHMKLLIWWVKDSWILAICRLQPTACMQNRFSHVWLFETPQTVACQAPLSLGFSRQGYWTGLPFPPLGDLSDPGIEPVSYISCVGRCILYHYLGSPGFNLVQNTKQSKGRTVVVHGWGGCASVVWRGCSGLLTGC